MFLQPPVRSSLAEEGAEGFFDLADGNEFDVELLAVEGREVVFRYDDMLEA